MPKTEQNPVAVIKYTFDYSTTDDLGNELTNVVGAAIYVKYPGKDWTLQGCVPYPTSLFQFYVNQDGMYAVRHCTRTVAVDHPSGPKTIAEGAPSPPVSLSVQCARASASGVGEVQVIPVDQVEHEWLED